MGGKKKYIEMFGSFTEPFKWYNEDFAYGKARYSSNEVLKDRSPNSDMIGG